jgi:hypothetical protein
VVLVGEVVLNDHGLVRAVTQSLASGYCPTNEALFLEQLFSLVALFGIAGIVLLRFGRVARIVGIMLVVFAIGAATIDLFGLSGCRGHIEKGLTWDHPW